MEKKLTIINIKGSVPYGYFDHWTGMRGVSTRMAYGGILFEGTDEELTQFAEKCYSDESFFKIIGFYDAEIIDGKVVKKPLINNTNN